MLFSKQVESIFEPEEEPYKMISTQTLINYNEDFHSGTTEEQDLYKWMMEQVLLYNRKERLTPQQRKKLETLTGWKDARKQYTIDWLNIQKKIVKAGGGDL
jgi:hypothetical protein